MAWQRTEKRSFFPWERRGGLIRRLGLYRLGPLLVALGLLGLLALIVVREREQSGIRRTRAVLLDVRQALDALALSNPMHLYWAGIGVSQIISNVPAAILLAEYSHDWPMIAFAVSVGGFGTLIGSLANLIALRMLGDRRAWWVFHAYSMPFLLAAAGIVYAWLMWLR